MRAEGRNKFVAVPNVYNLSLSGGEWAAGEGNGGVAIYAAVRRYATRMAKQPARRVRLTANAKGCREEG